MRLLIHLRWLLLLALGLGSSVAHASHILGGDIAYAPVAATTAGVPRYHVTVRLFRDVAGVDQPTVQLVCNRSGCAGAHESSDRPAVDNAGRDYECDERENQGGNACI